MRRADMDVTAMLPGLTITAEGVGMQKVSSMPARSGLIQTPSPLK